MPLAALFAVIAVSLSLSGCSAGRRPEAEVSAPPGGILLKGAGATFPSPLYRSWFAAYQTAHPATVVAYEAVGSGEGVRRFIGTNGASGEKLDFGASDAAMKDDEIAQVKPGVLLVPMTAGSVVLAYNLPDVTGELSLSRAAYTGIFRGEITSWNDKRIVAVNPGLKLPKLTIVTVVRQEASGTTFAFTKHMDAIDSRWRAEFGPATIVNWPGNAMRAAGNEGVAGRIEQSVGSIGYVSYEFARKLNLRMAALENRAGRYIHPGSEAATTALSGARLPENMRLFVPDPEGREAYPIVTFSWILLYRNYPDPAKAQAIRDLFGWCLSEGQKVAAQSGYVPLPANIITQALAALRSIGPAAK